MDTFKERMADTSLFKHSLEHDHHACGIHHLSWMSVVLGALVALGLGFLANIFSLAVGLTAYPLTEGKLAFATGGFLWLTVISIITMFISGWVAGFAARPLYYKRKLGEIYGFASWSLALLLAVLLTTNSGNYLAQQTYLVDRTNPAMRLTHEIGTTVTGSPAKAATVTPASAPLTEGEAATGASIAFATFFILAIGALSATFGGHIGIRSRKKEEIRIS